MSPRALVRAAVACLIAGTALTAGLGSGIALVAGVLLLLAFVVLGTLAVGSPGFLDDGDGEGG